MLKKSTIPEKQFPLVGLRSILLDKKRYLVQGMPRTLVYLNQEQRLVEQTRGQIKQFDASFNQYTQMRGMLKQLQQQTRNNEMDESRKEKLLADYDSLLVGYQVKLTKVAVAYQSAVHRLHQLTGK